MKRIFMGAVLAILALQSPVAWFSSTAKGESTTTNPFTADVTPPPPPDLAPEDTFTIFLPIVSRGTAIPGGPNWIMAGANPQRTSWISEQIDGNMSVEWYRPIEAYIDFKTQIIAVDGVLYISTARGLYALYALDPDGGGPLRGGDLKWRYDTELPMGQSPTVVNGVVYVGSYDKTVLALNASNGALMWRSSPAGSGFEANPVVVNNKVYIGNRDGYFYAYNAANGSLLWRYKTGGSICHSAAYDAQSDTLYFASNDMYAYALNAANGTLRWRSANKLPGEGFRNLWPVLYDSFVVFVSDTGTRHGENPGGDGFSPVLKELIYPNGSNTGYPNGALGPTFTAGGPDDRTGIAWRWVNGTKVMNLSYLIGVLQQHPYYQSHTFLYKNSGTPLGYPAPYVFNGGRNGEMYPPIVMPNGVIYQTSTYRYQEGISPFTDIMGWHVGTPYVSMTNLWTVWDERQEISAGGNRIYRRRYFLEGSSRDITVPNQSQSTYWSAGNSIDQQAPGYDSMNHVIDCSHAVGFCYWYGGKISSINGIYGEGLGGWLIPHRGRLYLIDRNAVIAFSPQGGSRQVPLLEISPVQNPGTAPGQAELIGRLEDQIQKMLNVYTPGDPDRFLKPGYYNDGQNLLHHHDDYFRNPGETLYTLSLAYPYLSSPMKAQLAAYLADYYQKYFGSPLISHTGWAEGTSRNAMRFAPEIEADFANYPAFQFNRGGWTSRYPQINIYALWKYAQINPGIAQDAYNKAKAMIEFHNLDDMFISPRTYRSYFTEFPFELQTYVAGYTGFLGLYSLVGSPPGDINLRNQAEQQRNAYLTFRYQSFTKDSYWYTGGNHHNRRYNIAVNFMWLVPEVGDFLAQNIQSRVRTAIQEYNYAAPFWFVSAFQGSYLESIAQPLFDVPALFQAKAYILKESRGELYKYLDAPVFERGDLFYIQNLIAVLAAP
jgi:outer membrane protein assembly factor BamB